jgi:CubicO group peptidase (beta-lactamase class C family)
MPSSVRLRLWFLSPLLLVLAQTLTAQQPIVRDSLGQRLDSLLRAALARGFHGSVLVARRGEVVLLNGYGFANHATNTRFSPSTLVQIGSNTKDFTATAIYQLIERGRLRLSDSLPRFFEGVPADKRGITVRHLLDHTAGLPLGMGGDERPLTKAQMFQELWALTLLSPPGSGKRYSNLGYSILAAIIEQLSGQPFDAYLARNIFGPAGMRETGLLLPRFDPARIAHGYAEAQDRGVILDLPHDADGHLWNLRGNGGHLSTVSDMLRFYRALRGPALLRDEQHRRAVIPFDQPGVWAGSDMTSFFLFANFPGAEIELFIASNHREYQGNRLLREIEPVLGLTRPGREVVTTGPGERREVETGPRPGGIVTSAPMLERVPETGIGRTVAAYLEAFNSGDTATMRRFFTERALSGPDSPPIDVRLERYRMMWSDVGRLTVRGVQQAPDGEGLIVVAAREDGETLTLTFNVEPEPPHRLRWIRIEIG